MLVNIQYCVQACPTSIAQVREMTRIASVTVVIIILSLLLLPCHSPVGDKDY